MAEGATEPHLYWLRRTIAKLRRRRSNGQRAVDQSHRPFGGVDRHTALKTTRESIPVRVREEAPPLPVRMLSSQLCAVGAISGGNAPTAEVGCRPGSGHPTRRASVRFRVRRTGRSRPRQTLKAKLTNVGSGRFGDLDAVASEPVTKHMRAASSSHFLATRRVCRAGRFSAYALEPHESCNRNCRASKPHLATSPRRFQIIRREPFRED